MDHMMPGMDGMETLKRIRAFRSCAEIPVVALTANAVSTARESFLAAGFDGFVSKPIELVELERVLRRVLPRASVTAQPASEQKAAPPPSEKQPLQKEESVADDPGEKPGTP